MTIPGVPPQRQIGTSHFALPLFTCHGFVAGKEFILAMPHHVIYKQLIYSHRTYCNSYNKNAYDRLLNQMLTNFTLQLHALPRLKPTPATAASWVLMPIPRRVHRYSFPRSSAEGTVFLDPLPSSYQRPHFFPVLILNTPQAVDGFLDLQVAKRADNLGREWKAPWKEGSEGSRTRLAVHTPCLHPYFCTSYREPLPIWL
jgi:hypothetical protein